MILFLITKSNYRRTINPVTCHFKTNAGVEEARKRIDRYRSVTEGAATFVLSHADTPESMGLDINS